MFIGPPPDRVVVASAGAAGGRTASTSSTVPADPSTITTSPSANCSGAPTTPTTAGTLYSRARIARWLSGLPVSATRPTIDRQRAGQRGVEGAHDEHLAGGARGSWVTAARARPALTPIGPVPLPLTSGTMLPSAARRNRAGNGGVLGLRRPGHAGGVETAHHVDQLAQGQVADVARGAELPAQLQPLAERLDGDDHQLLHPAHAQPQRLTSQRHLVVGAARREAGGSGTGGKARSPPMRGGNSARATGDEAMISASFSPRPRPRATAESATEAPVVADWPLLEEEPGEHLVGVEGAEGLLGVAQHGQQLPIAEPAGVGHGSQVVVDLADQVVGDARHRPAQSPDAPRGADSPAPTAEGRAGAGTTVGA